MTERNLGKIVSIVLVMVILFSLSACKRENKTSEVNLMTWGGDFIPREIINEFEKDTGIKINYKEVQSNEDMLSLLEANPEQYDLAVVTDYMIDIMRRNEYLEELDKSKLSNIGNINPVYQGNYYDVDDKYSIPYAISTSFLLVNKEGVEKLGAKPIISYKDMWQDELKDNIVIIDGAVEVMGLVLKSLGYEYNELDPVKVEKAKERLFALRKNIMRFETNTPEDSLINGEAVAGFMYSNQAVKGQDADGNLEPVFPEEGMPIFIDSFVMSKRAPHKEETYKFLNFIMESETAARIAEITKFTSPNKGAEDFLSDEFKNNIMLNMPDEVAANTDFYINVESVMEEYDHIYSEFKMQ
ncbi:MAG TPA: spermidine/putrescine ABC transporter substrate-binding protein [Oscillospiraceae bacterium]|nr:spermidine/putrescine ABC transporter substrate-binding protein [Oscillospiraceae bacterium]